MFNYIWLCLTIFCREREITLCSTRQRTFPSKKRASVCTTCTGSDYSTALGLTTCQFCSAGKYRSANRGKGLCEGQMPFMFAAQLQSKTVLQQKQTIAQLSLPSLWQKRLGGWSCERRWRWQRCVAYSSEGAWEGAARCTSVSLSMIKLFDLLMMSECCAACPRFAGATEGCAFGCPLSASS